MTTFLHTFTLALGAATAVVLVFALWFAGLVAPSSWLTDRRHDTLGVVWFIGYLLATFAAFVAIAQAAT